MALSFTLLDPGEANTPEREEVGMEIHKKVSGGLETCHNMISLHKEIVGLMLNFSKNAHVIENKIETLFPADMVLSQGEMDGFLQMFLTLQNFFRVWGQATEALGRALDGKSVKMMETRVARLERRKNKFLLYKKIQDFPSDECSDEQISGFSNARMSDQLVDDFQTKNRLRRGKIVKEVRYSGDDDEDGGINETIVKKNGAYTVQVLSFSMVDEWELVRLESLKTMMKASMDSFARFEKETGTWYRKISEKVHGFDVRSDIDNWIRSVLKDDPSSSMLNSKSKVSQRQENCLKSVSQAGGQSLTSPVDGKRMEDGNIYRGRGSQTSRLRQSNNLAVDTGQKNDVNGVEDDGGGQYRSRMYGAKEQGGEKGELHEGDGFYISRQPAQQLWSTAKGNSQLSIDQRSPSDSKSASLRDSVVMKSSTKLDTGCSRSSKDLQSGDWGLLSHVIQPLVKSLDKNPILTWIDIQRRYEKYLIDINNIDSDLGKNTLPWYDPLFYTEILTQKTAFQYPYKVPLGLASHFLNQHHWISLEWGSKKLDEFQWGCIAYETVLLVEDYFQQKEFALNNDSRPLSLNEVDLKQTLPNSERPFHDVYEDIRTVNANSNELLHSLIVKIHWKHVSDILTLMRLKLGLDGEMNSVIVQLTCHKQSFKHFSYSSSIHPLDMRYRVWRLIESWNKKKHGAISLESDKIKQFFEDWITRQLHLVHTALAFKFWRLLRYITSKEALYLWLNQSLDEKTQETCCFSNKDFDILNNVQDVDVLFLVSRLIKAFELCFKLILGLFCTLENKLWGVLEIPHQVKNCCSDKDLLHLINVMDYIVILDKRLRWMTVEYVNQNTVERDSVKVLFSDSCEDYMSDVLCECVNSWHFLQQKWIPSENLMSPQANSSHGALEGFFVEDDLRYKIPIGIYWRYESPLIQLIISYLWYSLTDRSKENVLHSESSRLGLTLLVISRVIESGQDTSCILKDEVSEQFKFATLSLHTHCFFLVNAMWNEMIQNFPMKSTGKKFSQQHDNLVEKSAAMICLRMEWLQSLYSLCCVKNFISWLVKDLYEAEPVKNHPSVTNGGFVLCPSIITIMSQDERDLLLKICYDLLLHTFYSPWYALAYLDADVSQSNILDELDFKVFSLEDLVFTKETLHSDEVWAAIAELFIVANKYGQGTTKSHTKEEGSAPLNSLVHIQSKLRRAVYILFQYQIPPPKFSELNESATPSGQSNPSILLDALSSLRRQCFELNCVKKKQDEKNIMETEAKKFSRLRQRKDSLTEQELSSAANYGKPVSQQNARGLSLILPSRIERVMMEIIYNRLLSSSLRSSLIDILGNYHFQLDPESLCLLLKTWNSLHSNLLEIVKVGIDEPCQEKELIEPFMGPTPRENFYRYLIFRSIFRVINTTFKKYCFQGECSFDMKVDSDVDVESAYVTSCSQTLKQLWEEIRGEFLYYTQSWNAFLPCNEHALIVIFAVNKLLPPWLREIADHPIWKKDGFPARGIEVIEGVARLERLLSDVRVSLGLPRQISTVLFEPFRQSAYVFFQNYFTEMKSIIGRCLESDQWKVVPGELYSLAVLDFFTYTHQFISLFFESNFPVDWIFKEFLSLFAKLVSDFLVANAKILQKKLFVRFVNEINTCFATLAAPSHGVKMLREDEDHSFHISVFKHIPQKVKKSRILRTMKKIGYSKFSKHTPTEIETFSESISDSKYLSSGIMEDSDPSTYKNLSTPGCCDTSETPDQQKEKNKKNHGKPFLNAADEYKFFSNKNFLHLKRRLGNSVAMRYLAIQHIFKDISLKTCLVRLYNLKQFSDQLVMFYTACCEILQSETNRPSKDNPMVQESLFSSKSSLESTNTLIAFIQMNAEKTQSFEEFKELLETYRNIYLKMTQDALEKLYSNVAFRIVLYEFGEDYFDELYHPEFNSFPFHNILNGLKKTVEKFIGKLPTDFQQPFRQVFMECSVKLWCYIISNMGFNGTRFLPEDLDVLENDLQCLRSTLESLPGIQLPFQVTLNAKLNLILEQQNISREVNLITYVNEFFVWLKANPDFLAELGQSSVDQQLRKPEANEMHSYKMNISHVSDHLSLTPSHSETGHVQTPPSADPSFTYSKDILETKKKKTGWIHHFL